MRKRTKLLFALILIPLVLALFWAIHRDPGPQFRGRSVKGWLDACANGHTLSQQNEAKQAIVEIGSNALPFLVSYIQYIQPPWKTKTLATLAKLRRLPVAGSIVPYSMTIDAAGTRAETATDALAALGKTATPAYPDLVRIACNAATPEAADRAIRVFMLASVAATDELGEVLTTAPAQIRLKALLYIASGHNKGLLRALQTHLIHCLNGSYDEVAKWAAIGLTELKFEETDQILAVLMEALKNPKPKVRVAALTCIATFDTGATPALPSVRPLLNDPDPEVRKEAATLLRIIAPADATGAASR